MGGFMSYQRMRSRNGLMFRKPDLPEVELHLRGRSQDYQSHWWMLTGDMNRMERDYLGSHPGPDHPDSRGRAGGSLSDEVAEHTGVDVETVKKVLRYVFLEQS